MQEKNTREQGEKWTKQREKSTTLCHSFFVEVLLSKINEKRNSNLFFPLFLFYVHRIENVETSTN